MMAYNIRLKETINKIQALLAKYRYPVLAALLCLFTLFSCQKRHDKSAVAGEQHYQIKTMPLHKSLHFTGTVQPLQEHTLTSPMEAVVESMPFHYGQMVKSGQVIFTLNSEELQKQYNETLTDYLKAKDNYGVAKAKFVGTQDLWESGLLSKNNYLSEKSGIDNARITLMQATRKLSSMLEKLEDASIGKVSDLSLADFEKVRSMLGARHNLIRIKATGDGVLLYPPKSSDDKSGRIAVGSSVKAGQVLGLIGDLQGISVEIDVPEIDIDKIHAGMDASIGGIAFGGQELKGKLVAVNAQASSTGTAGLPSFSAVVEVASLTPQQRKWIKVGMSAAIEIRVDSPNQLFVPIEAVKREKGQSLVLVEGPKGQRQKRVITTGAAQSDLVVVESGLKAGDVVVYG